MRNAKKPTSNNRFLFDVHVSKEPAWISAQTPETRLSAEHFAADNVSLSLLVFTQLFSNVAVSAARRTGAETEFNVK